MLSSFAAVALRPVRSLLAGRVVRGAGDWSAFARGFLRRAAVASFGHSTRQ
jgi:hypothetical protein